MARHLLSSATMRCCFVVLAGLALSAGACGSTDAHVHQERDADLLVEGSFESEAVLALVNDPAVGVVELDDAASLYRTAARNIVAHRDGFDGLPQTGDDNLFDDIAELDGVPYVGPSALSALLNYAIEQGYLDTLDELRDDVMSDVVFSPQPSDSTHNVRIAELIASAQDTLDIAMYSFSNQTVRDALIAASERGVAVRMLFETGNGDRRLDGEELLASRSGILEQAGINVRYVNKIMHHKFVIVDGPQTDPQRALTATVASGSANWSNSAGTRYDENTLFLRGHQELTQRMQREFDYLWNHSRDVPAVPELEYVTYPPMARQDIADGDDLHAYFTSDNFDLYETSPTTFRVTGRNTVSDALVAAIERATESIWVASGHLRLRPVSEALMAKIATDPSMDIRVYLDGQEYIGETTHNIQVQALEECLEEAGTSESRTRRCKDRGFRFGYIVGESGIDVRYKYYAYRWHYSYAPQMHHKYLIIDGDELWTGSYNLSDNAEHNTMENMLHFSGAGFAELVDAYEANFEKMWETGRNEDQLAELRQSIASQGVIPLVFDSMALSWQEVRDLKGLIYANCEQVNSPEFRSNPGDHRVCERG